MKKQLGIILALGLTLNVVDINGKAAKKPSVKKPDAMKLSMALSGLASKMLETIPKLIQDIPEFPDKVKEPAQQLRTAVMEVGKMPQKTEEQKKLRTAKLEEVFVKAVNVLVPIQNILDDFLGMAKLIGPVVEAFDKKAGQKMIESVSLIAQTLYIITKVSVGQQKIVKEEENIKAPAPESIEVPDL